MKLEDKFKPFVNGYIGSSMLTNTEYPETINENAENCKNISIDFAIKFNKFINEKVMKSNLYDRFFLNGEAHNMDSLIEVYLEKYY